MNKIEELIKELCPDGVKYKKISNCIGLNRGSRLTKSQLLDDGKYEVYHGSKDTILGYYNQSNAPKNTTIVVNTGGIGGVKFIDKEFWCSDGSFWLGHSSELNDKFLYYYVSQFEEYFESQKRVGGVPTIDRTTVENLEIPVPPMEIQREIVQVLDNFAELSAELQLRRKQYEFYRDKLLKFDFEITTEKLGSIVKIKNGKDYKHLSGGTIPVYGSGGIMTYVNEYCYDKPSILIPRKGSLDKLYFVETPFWNVDTIFYTEIDESKTIPKYLYYLLQNTHLEKLNIAGGVPSLTQSILNNIELKLPNLNVQKKVVEVLDNFDKICSDLGIGLPAEIEARQKQYEYYREKLLKFDKQVGGGIT